MKKAVGSWNQYLIIIIKKIDDYVRKLVFTLEN